LKKLEFKKQLLAIEIQLEKVRSKEKSSRSNRFQNKTKNFAKNPTASLKAHLMT
jgi:hypothetical protein